MGATKVAGVRCVSPIQAYLDLKALPERSEDIARDLRERFMPWRAHAQAAKKT
jgi:hypothetical protein